MIDKFVPTRSDIQAATKNYLARGAHIKRLPKMKEPEPWMYNSKCIKHGGLYMPDLVEMEDLGTNIPDNEPEKLSEVALNLQAMSI